MDDHIGNAGDAEGETIFTTSFGGAQAARRVIQAEARRAPAWPLDPDIRLTELEVELDTEERILWAYQLHTDRPNFTPELIRDVGRLEDQLVEKAEGLDELPVDYLVWASRKPNIFNLGGDLGLFVDLIEVGDRDGLRHYADSCVDICFRNAINLGLPIMTAALVQGDALGGGFESVLSSDLIVAERGAQFGFPEILFGLFPGMGAYTLLARRAGRLEAERMIFSGRLYKAAELHEMGVVDILADNGQGEHALLEHIAANRRRQGALKALYSIRQDFNPVTRAEMDDIASRWVETALTLDANNIKKMRRLARAQKRLIGEEQEAAEPRENGRKAQPTDARQADESEAQAEASRVVTLPVTARAPKPKEPAEPDAERGAHRDDRTSPGSTSARHVNFDRMLKELAPDRAAAVQQPGVRRLLTEGTDRETYLEFLGELYHVVKHFCPTMEIAAGRCGDEHADLRRHLLHSIEEERGHDAWVLNDIAALGGDPEAVMESKPSVPIQAMIGFNYDNAQRHNPWSVMGMVYVLEEVAANFASRVARRVAERIGVETSEGFSFLYSHGDMDQAHVEEFKALTDVCVERADQNALVEAARVNYALFGALFRDD